MRHRHVAAGILAILFTLGAATMLADGTTDGASEEAIQGTVAAQDASTTSSDAGSEKPFPILPLVGGVLLGMTLALHHAAGKWAH